MFRRYSILTNDYRLCVYKVFTDNVYRVIGKIVCTSLEEIKNLYFDSWSQSREQFFIDKGVPVFDYNEPILSAER